MRSARGVGVYAAERRELRGLTQAELAKRADVSREWVSRFERGDGSPSLRAVMDVLRELDVELFAETADESPDEDRLSPLERRSRAVRDARRSSELEGSRSTDETRRDQDAYVRGEIDIDELGARVRQRHGAV